MRFLSALLLVLSLSQIQIVTSVGGEIETYTFSPGDWEACGINCWYLEFAVPGLSGAEIDSIWVKVEGVSNKGSISFSHGGQHVTYDCWDGLLVSFECGEEDFSCNYESFNNDGIPDYNAGFYRPSGDQALFEETLYLLGMERTRCCDLEFEVLDQNPNFGDLFSQGSATLRVQMVSGGLLGPSNGCNKCYDGLAQINTVTVNVAYSGFLPVFSTQWGSLKACYK